MFGSLNDALTTSNYRVLFLTTTNFRWDDNQRNKFLRTWKNQIINHKSFISVIVPLWSNNYLLFLTQLNHVYHFYVKNQFSAFVARNETTYVCYSLEINQIHEWWVFYLIRRSSSDVLIVSKCVSTFFLDDFCWL